MNSTAARAKLLARLLTALLAATFFLSSSHAQDPSSGPYSSDARAFVSSILEKAGQPTLVTVLLENRSSLSANEATQIRKAIEAQLRAAKVQIVKAERAQAEVKVTLSENLHGDLWVAEIKLGAGTQVVMREVARVAGPAYVIPAKFELQDQLVSVQPGQILDFAMPDPQTIYMLRPESVSWFARDGVAWTIKSSAAVSHSTPWPRDLRGRITADGKNFEVHLPGVRCTGKRTSSLALDCQASEDPWPLTTGGNPEMSAFFSPTRNFF